jgi:hypothetical protein
MMKEHKKARDHSLGAPEDRAPASLKSRIYSNLVKRMEQTGPLLPVEETEVSHGLCVFEKLVEIAPLPGRAKTFNACSVCHARVLAERFEHAPIYWKNCPYVEFKSG